MKLPAADRMMASPLAALPIVEPAAIVKSPDDRAISWPVPTSLLPNNSPVTGLDACTVALAPLVCTESFPAPMLSGASALPMLPPSKPFDARMRFI